REETATPTRARAARPSSRKPPRRKRPSGPVPPLAKLDQRVVDAVVSGQRAVNHDLYEDVFQAWFRTHLVHHDWDVLEKGAALPDFFTACVESMDSDWVGFGWQDHLDLCHQWMKERPRSVVARTAFARVALACLWSEHRETDDDEALEREIAQSLNPDRVSQAPPEFGCTLLEFDLLKRVDDKTFQSHRNLLPADEPEATLLAAVRESSWFNDGPEADDWWQSIDDPAQLAQASEKLGHYPFARSFRRKKNVYRQAPPQDQEADAWAAVAANCQDIRLLNAAARSWMPAFHPDLGVEALEKIGPNFTLSEWTNFRDYERLREQYLAGRPAAPLGPDPTEDLSFFEVRPMGLEGVLLGQQIRDLVLRERPHELHAIAAALHKSDARLPNGQSKLVAFMHGLNDTRNVSREREEQFDKTLNLWYAAYPKSDLPKLAGAYAYTSRAEWYRGVEEQASLGLLQEADAMLQTIGVQSPWRVEAQLL
ncbi:MAG: hypothetical protein KC910_35210, partial [Candidatus Eremiobacteraeota bacterium]|nr:hypothetical protein [Candidatus Eremiobacteraeota bacterium]